MVQLQRCFAAAVLASTGPVLLFAGVLSLASGARGLRVRGKGKAKSDSQSFEHMNAYSESDARAAAGLVSMIPHSSCAYAPDVVPRIELDDNVSANGRARDANPQPKRKAGSLDLHTKKLARSDIAKIVHFHESTANEKTETSVQLLPEDSAAAQVQKKIEEMKRENGHVFKSPPLKGLGGQGHERMVTEFEFQ